MASAQASAKLSSHLYIEHALSGDASTAKKVGGYIDMRDYDKLMVTALAAALTGAGVTAFSIYASTAESESGAVAVKSHAVGSAPDAAGDWLLLECTAEEIRQLGDAAGKALRYAYVVIDADNSADNIAVTIIAEAIRKVADLAADYVSA